MATVSIKIYLFLGSFDNIFLVEKSRISYQNVERKPFKYLFEVFHLVSHLEKLL